MGGYGFQGGMGTAMYIPMMPSNVNAMGDIERIRSAINMPPAMMMGTLGGGGAHNQTAMMMMGMQNNNNEEVSIENAVIGKQAKSQFNNNDYGTPKLQLG